MICFLQVVKELLDRGADPNAPCGKCSALVYAARAEDVEMVKSLLAQGANPNDDGGNDGESVLLVALHQLLASTEKLGHAVAFPMSEAKAKGLLQMDKKEAAPVQQSNYLDNKCPALGIVLALLQAGADVNAPDKDGQYPIHVAASIANEYGLRVLPQIVRLSRSPDVMFNNETALSVAIANGNVAGAQVLLMGRACPNLKLSHHRTALQKLLQKSSEELFFVGARLALLRIMFEHGANPLQKVNITEDDHGCGTSMRRYSPLQPHSLLLWGSCRSHVCSSVQIS